MYFITPVIVDLTRIRERSKHQCFDSESLTFSLTLRYFNHTSDKCRYSNYKISRFLVCLSLCANIDN